MKAKKVTFQDNLAGELTVTTKEVVPNEKEKEQETGSVELLPKKSKKKDVKKSFPLYMQEEKVRKLDKICNKTGYSRNELINILIDKGLEVYGY